MPSINDNGGYIGNRGEYDLGGIWKLNSTDNRIVRNNLQLYVDAGNLNSYTGSGSTWNDISGNAINMTLINSPTFTNGYFSLNGTTQYARSSVLPTAVTDNYALMAAIYPSNISQLGIVLLNGRDDGTNTPFNGYAFGVGNGAGAGGSKLQGLNSSVAWLDSGYTFPSANAWYVIVQTRESGTTKWYVNGVQTASTSASVPVTPTQSCSVGAAWGTVASRFFAGRIAMAAIYSKALTLAEVTQNFNAIRGRFDI